MRPTVAIDARLIGGTNTGDSTYWTGLLHGLATLSLDFKVLLYSNAAQPPEIPWNDNFEWITLPAKNGRWWSLVAFPLAARRAGAQVIHAQYALSPLVGGGGITTIHDVSFFIGPQWFRPRDRFLLQRSVPASARRAARVLAVSETTKREIAQYIPGVEAKTEVTTNGCTPWIHALDPEDAQSRVAKELGIDRPYLLTVGTRWPRKNFMLAAAAAELLPDSFPHQLIVTGKEGWGEEALGRRGKAVGYVSVGTLSALYSAADLYLCPSYHEGFGIPVLEAFVCGCPVLCSSGGALPEVAGDAAWVEKSWEANDWGKAISNLLGDSSKLSAMREKGLERATRFTWKDTARKTAEIYRQVMG